MATAAHIGAETAGRELAVARRAALHGAKRLGQERHDLRLLAVGRRVAVIDHLVAMAVQAAHDAAFGAVLGLNEVLSSDVADALARRASRRPPVVEAERVIHGYASSRCKDGFADEFWDSGDDGVAEGLSSVHPIRYPIIHSKKRGFVWPDRLFPIFDNCSFSGRLFFSWVSSDAKPERQSRAVGVGSVPACFVSYPRKTVRRSPRPLRSASVARGVGSNPLCASSKWFASVRPNPLLPCFFASLSRRSSKRSGSLVLNSFAVGVGSMGDDIDPVPLMRGAEGARRYAIPLKIKPALGHVPENCSHPVSKQRCHVLHDCVFRSYQAKGSHQFPVESRTLSGKPGALPDSANVLAGEPPADDICLSWAKFSGSNVIVDWNPGPVLRKYALTEGFDFAKRHRLEPARPFQTERETTDAAKQIKHPQHSSSHIESRNKTSMIWGGFLCRIHN